MQNFARTWIFQFSGTDTEAMSGPPGVDAEGTDSTCSVVYANALIDSISTEILTVVYNTIRSVGNVMKSGIGLARLKYLGSGVWDMIEETLVEEFNVTASTCLRPTVAIEFSPDTLQPAALWLVYIQYAPKPNNPPEIPVVSPLWPNFEQGVYLYRVMKRLWDTTASFVHDTGAENALPHLSSPLNAATYTAALATTRSMIVLSATSPSSDTVPGESRVWIVFSDASDYATWREIRPSHDAPPVRLALVSRNPNGQWSAASAFYTRDTDEGLVDQYDGDGAHFSAVSFFYPATSKFYIHVVTNNGLVEAVYLRDEIVVGAVNGTWTPKVNFDVPQGSRFDPKGAYQQISFGAQSGKLLAIVSADDNLGGGGKVLASYYSNDNGATWALPVFLAPYLSETDPVNTDKPRLETPAIIAPSQGVIQGIVDASQTPANMRNTFAGYFLP